MFSKKLMTAALAIAAAGAFAGSAQASVVDYDDVRLTSLDYDFGGSGFAFAEPVGSGEIHFHHENGGVIRPHLLGTIHLNDADGTCGRMRMEYYNAAGSWLNHRPRTPDCWAAGRSACWCGRASCTRSDSPCRPSRSG